MKPLNPRAPQLEQGNAIQNNNPLRSCRRNVVVLYLCIHPLDNGQGFIHVGEAKGVRVSNCSLKKIKWCEVHFQVIT